MFFFLGHESQGVAGRKATGQKEKKKNRCGLEPVEVATWLGVVGLRMDN